MPLVRTEAEGPQRAPFRNNLSGPGEYLLIPRAMDSACPIPGLWPRGVSPTCAKWWRHRSGSSAPTIDVSWDGGGGDLLPCPRSPFLAVHFTIIRRDAAKTTRGPRRDTHVDYPPLPRHNAPVADSTGGGTRLTWQPTIASVANTSTRRAAAPQRPAALRSQRQGQPPMERANGVA